MKLKLKTSTFKFRRELPDDCPVMGPDGCKSVFIEIEARPASGSNPEFIAAMEAIGLEETILERRRAVVGRGDDEAAAEAVTQREHDETRRIAQKRVAAFYDACVVSWETNICDENDTIIDANRENFLALADVKIAEVAQVFIDFFGEASGIGSEIDKQDEATIKN